jgi:hypothetical protein
MEKPNIQSQQDNIQSDVQQVPNKMLDYYLLKKKFPTKKAIFVKEMVKIL